MPYSDEATVVVTNDEPTVVIPPPVWSRPYTPPVPPPSRLRRTVTAVSSWVLPLVAMLIGAYHYFMTLYFGVGPNWQAVRHQLAVQMGGVVEAHHFPLYLGLGRLFSWLPIGRIIPYLQSADSVSLRLTLLSYLAAILLLFVVTRWTYQLTNNPLTAFFSALLLASGQRFWYQAITSNPNVVQNLFIASSALFFIHWVQSRRYLHCLLSGLFLTLSIATHASSFILLPAWIMGVLLTDFSALLQPRNFSRIFAIFFFPLLIFYFWTPVKTILGIEPLLCQNCPQSFNQLPSFFFGQFFSADRTAFALPPALWLTRWVDSSYEWMWEVWPFGLLLGAVGIGHLFRHQWRIASALLAAIISVWLFIITDQSADWGDGLPTLTLFLTPAIGVGMTAIWQWWRRQSSQWLNKTHHSRSLALLHVPLLMGAFYLCISLFTHLRRSWPPSSPVLAFWQILLLTMAGLWLFVFALQLLRALWGYYRQKQPILLFTHSLRFIGSLLLTIAPALLLIIAFTSHYNRWKPLSTQSMIWQTWAVQFAQQLQSDAWLLVPSPHQNPTAYAQAHALQLVAQAEGYAQGLRLLYPPDTTPLGAPPTFLAFDYVKNELARKTVYVIEIDDPRTINYALLPLYRTDGYPVGYQIVAERVGAGDELTEWISAEQWQALADQIILPR